MGSKKYYESLSGGILLIGLGILFLTPIGFWPWILVVVGLAGLPAALAQHRGWMGWQGFFWLVGLALLFSTRFFWPGILILIGLSLLVGALMRDSQGSPFASGSSAPVKPTAPLPEREPFAPDETDQPTDQSSGESKDTQRLSSE